MGNRPKRGSATARHHATSLLRQFRQGSASERLAAAERLIRSNPILRQYTPQDLVRADVVRLKHAQHVIAAERGFPTWAALVAHSSEAGTTETQDDLAQRLAVALGGELLPEPPVHATIAAAIATQFRVPDTASRIIVSLLHTDGWELRSWREETPTDWVGFRLSGMDGEEVQHTLVEVVRQLEADGVPVQVGAEPEPAPRKASIVGVVGPEEFAGADNPHMRWDAPYLLLLQRLKRPDREPTLDDLDLLLDAASLSTTATNAARRRIFAAEDESTVVAEFYRLLGLRRGSTELERGLTALARLARQQRH